MGGIAGCYGSRDEKTIKRMLEALDHRDPQEGNLHSAQKMVWGQSSSLKVETDRGQQPILNEDKSKGVVASGEIYNFQRLRDRLQERYPFQTRYDSEVILALYDQRGPDGVRDLDGMFALALFDAERDTFLLARDPIGIKSLYYGYRNGTIYFTSELAVLKLAEVEEVLEFPPGHYYTPADGFIRYYRVPPVDKRPLVNVASIGLRIRKTLTRSVNKRIVKDPQVAMGSLCNGDFASAITSALAARKRPDLHTFTVGIADGNGDPGQGFRAARQAAAHIGSNHHELIVGQEEYSLALPQVIHQLASYHPPEVRAAVLWSMTSKLAAQYVSVVLSTEGADELFAGYHYMKELPLAEVNEECRRCLGDLHHLHLQQTDPVVEYFNLEMRAPFLDKDMISLAMKIPADLKIRDRQSDPKMSKWIFRHAFSESGFLPDEILWPAKMPQSQSARCKRLAGELAEREVGGDELRRLRFDHPEAQIDSKEAALYFNILQGVYP